MAGRGMGLLGRTLGRTRAELCSRQLCDAPWPAVPGIPVLGLWVQVGR